MNKNIPIFFATDDGYIPFLAVALESIKQNASKGYKYLIKVLCNKHNVSKANIQKIYKFNDENFDIEFVDVSSKQAEINSKMHTRDYYSKATYYRIYIPELFPNFDKALYLDCDIIVKGDISELYNIDLEDNYIGAISDGSILCIKEFQDYVINCIGVDRYEDYINAGILVLNTKKLREIKFEDLFISALTLTTIDVAQDQDYINAICKGHIKYIGEEWDKMPIRETIKEEDIKIIHYNLNFKPWLVSDVMYSNYFWKYAKQTEFFDYINLMKANRTKEMQDKEALTTQRLILNAKEQAENSFLNLERLTKIKTIIKEFKKQKANAFTVVTKLQNENEMESTLTLKKATN